MPYIGVISEPEYVVGTAMTAHRRLERERLREPDRRAAAEREHGVGAETRNFFFGALDDLDGHVLFRDRDHGRSRKERARETRARGRANDRDVSEAHRRYFLLDSLRRARAEHHAHRRTLRPLELHYKLVTIS